MLYCSQLIVLAFLEAANFDLQDELDSIPSMAKLFSGSLKKIVNLSADQRLIAPNGLIWQSKIVEDLVTIHHDRQRVALHGGTGNKTLAESYTHALDNVDGASDAEIDQGELRKIPAQQNVPNDYED